MLARIMIMWQILYLYKVIKNYISKVIYIYISLYIYIYGNFIIVYS